MLVCQPLSFSFEIESGSTVTLAAVMLIGILYLQSENSIPNATALSFCMSMAEEQSKVGFMHKVPTKFPSNYDFKCASASQTDAMMLYWDQPITYDNLTSGSAFENGAIKMSMKLYNEKTDPVVHIANRTAGLVSVYEELGPQKAKLTHLLGNVALVRGQCDSCGVQTATFPDGSKITHNTSLPSLIVFFDGDVEYVIEANLPSDMLEKFAQSLE